MEHKPGTYEACLPRPGRLRTWWWNCRHSTARAIYKRPLESLDRRLYVMMRQRQKREPFEEWEDIGIPEGLTGVTWPQSAWDRLDDDGYVVLR